MQGLYIRRNAIPHILRHTMTQTKDTTVIEVLAAELPVYCPNPKMARWSSHPRVFIDVSHGETGCPYCGTRYTLKAGEVVKGHH
jgi:uncharacterized Zn-finger protein